MRTLPPLKSPMRRKRNCCCRVIAQHITNDVNYFNFHYRLQKWKLIAFAIYSSLNNYRDVTLNFFAKVGTTSHDCKRVHKKWQSANSGGARGRDFYFISRARSFGATTTRSRSLFSFLARLLATFKSASRRGCSPSSFSVLHRSWRVPAHWASLRPLQTLILSSFLLFLFLLFFLFLSLSLSLFLFSIFFFTLNLPCGGRARVVALINF